MALELYGIIAVNDEGYIGLDNKLPWKCLADLRHFKEKTNGCTVLVGYNTYSTLPHLPRRTVVLDQREEWASSFLDILETMTKYSKVWVIGGKKTYEKYAPYMKELHISHIKDSTIGDTVYPDFSTLKEDCKIIDYYFNVD